MKKYNINLHTFAVVACVETEALNLTQISQMLDISSASMTTIRDAAKDGYFIEELDSPDRRKKFYNITDLGKEMLARARQ